MKKITRIIKEVTRYVSDDGMEFDTKWECEKHERYVKTQNGLKKLDKYRIREYDNQIPLYDEAYFSEFSIYTWYRVKNKKELEEIEDVYGEPVREVNSFPTIVCMEREEENYIGQPYSITIEEIMDCTRSFFKHLGYDVKIERM